MRDVGKPAIGKITSGPVRDALARETIHYVYTQLPAWRDDRDRPDEQSENKLNSQLCKFLNTTRARNAFPMVKFEHEEYQTGRRSVDISASPNAETTIGAKLYTPYDSIVVFECKRLPAPSHDREKNYVTGGTERKSGGIQRFKLGLHGPKHDIAAMVGYLQAGSAFDWHDKINKWITELSNGTIPDVCFWNVSEMLEILEEDSSKGVANCSSTHNRSGSVKSNKILIRHLWVTMHS